MTHSEDDKHIRQRIRELRQKAEDLGLGQDEFKSLFRVDPTTKHSKKFRVLLKTKLLFRRFLSYSRSFCQLLFSKTSLFLMIVIGVLNASLDLETTFYILSTRNRFAHCGVYLPDFWFDLMRPAVPCEMCEGLKEFPVVHNITREEFARSYAYTGVPVMIKGAIADWGALKTFNFEYFKNLYNESEASIDHVMENCSFFRYQTEFEELDDVFKMSTDRAALKNGTRPWYIGWSNCHTRSNHVGRILESQYDQPHFLPSHSKNLDTAWIFMGGPGFGSGMHIDIVEKPSWQAQVSGSKTWLLEPSPECSRRCRRLEVTLQRGDIIVVDTNIWYHSTRVNPGEISIAIGAEYD